MISLASVALLAALLWGIAKIIENFVIGHSRLPYPPGPKPKFIIGNALDFPLVNASRTYLEWSKKYDSSILHIEVLRNHVIVLNTLEDAVELLEKRARNYSDRPVIPMLKLMGWDYNIGFLGHNDEWRYHRRICQDNFRKAAAHKYHPLQIQKVHEMLQNLLESPSKLEEHNKMLSVSIPLLSMYGYEARSLDDPCIKAADEGIVIGAPLLLPGGNFIDIFPALARIPPWVPGAYAVRIASRVKQLTEIMKRVPMEHVERRFAEGKAIPSLVTDMLERKLVDAVSAEEETAVQNIAYTVYGAASDTTIAVTKAFFYFMAKCPNAQKKAHAEIDTVLGNKRLPDFNDRSSGKMPYVEAIYRELMRIAAPLPLCVPHRASEEDHYKGYFIPKGATIFPNIWAMTHNEEKYPDPFSFKPERFLDASGNLNDDDRVLAYGFGRRLCVGKYIASSTMWLMIVSVLACFDIEKTKDGNGNYMEMDDEFEDFGMLMHKAKYECSITARSSEARQLISSTQ